MKRTLMISASLLLLFASHSFAQGIPGVIGVYADAAGTACNVVDDGGLLQVHMLHLWINGAKASQFALDVSATDWTWLGDIWDFELVIGSSLGGAAISYEGCVASSSIHLGKATFIGSIAPSCTEISIVPDPGMRPTPRIQAIDCDDNRVFPTGGLAYVNPDPSCQCSVPVEETTWGQIKALYK